MSFEKCISEVSAALGRQLTDDEAIDLFESVQRRVKKAKEKGGSFDDAVKQSKKEMTEEEKTARFVKKRDVYLSYKARINLLDYVDSNFADNKVLGLQSYMVGSQLNRTASKSSIAAQIVSARADYLSGITGDLKKGSYEKMLLSGQFDREIGKALWAINRREELPYEGPKEAMEIARIIKKYQDVMVKDQNDAGANISLYEGYIVRNSHDADKIASAKYETWSKDILERLDIDRTFEGRDIDETLKGIFENLSNGTHYKVPDKITGFKGGTSNIGRRLSEERFFHWKSADDWFEYNQKYGYGNISQAIFKQMEITARNVVMMRKLGPNPKDTLNKVVEYIKARKDTDAKTQKELDKAIGKYGKLNHQFDEISGATQMIHNNYAAKVGYLTRGFNAITQLGGAVIASLTDIGGIMTHLKYQGFDLFDGVHTSVSALAKGRRADEIPEVLSSNGVFHDSMIGEIANVGFAEDGAPGMMAKMTNLFFKWNGLTWWTESLRSSTILAMSNLFAHRKNLAFDQLNAENQRVLKQYNIDADKWDMARQTATKASDGKEYLMPHKIADLPDQVFADYLIKRGQFPSEVTFKTAKGSEYKFDKGKSIRNKKERADVGHEGDAGIKPQSLKTVFLTEQGANALGTPSNVEWRFIDNNDGTVSLAVKNKDGKWGMSPSQKNIKYTTEPSIGAIPLELWGRGTINERPSYKEIHFGNKIVEITKSQPLARDIKELKRDIQLEWRTFFSDNARTAVLEPDALTRSMMQRGYQKGSYEREFLDYVGQYKSFPIAFIQKVIGREIYGRGSNTVAEAIKNKNGELWGLANVFLISTMFGYASMNMKDILTGKNPRNPEDAFGYYKLVLAAMARGGGAGLYGDFLFGEMKSRYGAGPLESLLGPTYGKLSSVADLFARVKNGDDVAASAFKFMISNTPGNNIWWAKMPIDYGITYRFMEMSNPGALRRMETRIKKEQDQTFIFPPSQAVR